MISFIIPAYNEELVLGRTLDALDDAARASGESFEVVVVDDASTDRTALVARQHGARVVSVNHRQIAATRNAGARESVGELLIFVDADTVVSRSAVRAAVEAMRAGAVGGGCAYRYDGDVPLYGRLLESLAVHLFRALGLANGCFLFCAREAFHSAGGFDEGLFCSEEVAMSRALHRQGRFVVLRESVTTSGRKFRAYSFREVSRVLARIAFNWRKSVRQQRGLELWYGERRKDPALGSLSTVIAPPSRATSRAAIERPRPVPPYFPVVEVSARSKIQHAD